ncbi:MAG: hypothetical protein INR71_06060 [Terriglobus roseus]|nr:hypothetical protein [Terriglobus roseus]
MWTAFDDGRAALLLCLFGTIGVEYRGGRYNIPISVWVTHKFPQEAPLCFVNPTADMVIRKGSYVNAEGRCIGAYLDGWDRKHEVSSYPVGPTA